MLSNLVKNTVQKTIISVISALNPINTQRQNVICPAKQGRHKPIDFANISFDRAKIKRNRL
jgi:hypothetical protein